MKSIRVCLRRAPSLRWSVAFFCLLLTRQIFAGEAVQFTYRAPQVGQQASHEMKFTLELNISLHQAGQTISSEMQQLTRDQDRQVTVLQVTDNKATKVQVFYSKAWEEVSRGKQASTPQTQPIEGKSYLVQRRGEDLVVTDPQGGEVPEEERSLVAASMDAVGHPSPLGEYLNGKKMAIGQTLRMPNEMASVLLGVKDIGGDAQKVELTLHDVNLDEDHRRLATFEMLVVLKLPGGGTMNVKGQLQIEPESCQVASASFDGPVSMREEQGPTGHTFEVASDGTMKVAVRSHYLK
ncbi:MAG TPA: hypothetical protein VFE46_09360 [Pirellulales bacterium]|jgi:hypothetical protein|nr:hypothetical protein [Pirellulales bacterium]